MVSTRDIELGEVEPLLKADVLESLKKDPVGGEPGDPNFKISLQLGLRGAIFSVLLGLLVWEPHLAAWCGLDGYAEFIPLAISVLVFCIGHNLGRVVDNAAAAVSGVFVACLNIFILRGIFPEGVQSDSATLAPERVVAWVDILVFNVVMLASDVRLATKVFAMALSTCFILSFLKPSNALSASDQFQIHWEGEPVRAFIGVSVGGIVAIVSMLVPYPWQLASVKMKSNAQKSAGHISSMLISAVKYSNGSSATFMIEKQLHQLDILRKDIDELEVGISAAYHETWDIGWSGVVRGFMLQHSALLDELYDIIHAMLLALEVEDFSSSHIKIMQKVGEASAELANSIAFLLMSATSVASHSGEISGFSRDRLTAGEASVKKATAKLSAEFDKARRAFKKPLCRELLNESAFAFNLCAYGRHVREYSERLRKSSPRRIGALEAATGLSGCRKGATQSSGGAVVIARNMVALTLCFIFSVFVDNCAPPCAITGVLLVNTHASPNLKTSLNSMMAVVVSSVVSAILFAEGCRSGHGAVLLPAIFFLYMMLALQVAMSRSSFAGVGFVSALLAPLTLVAPCPGASSSGMGAPTDDTTWIDIRGRFLAVSVVTLCEFVFMEKRHSAAAADYYEDALEKIQEAFRHMWKAKDPKPALRQVAASLARAAESAEGAKVEPRLGACKWKCSFVRDCFDAVTRLRVDILLSYRGVNGLDGKGDRNFSFLAQAPGFKLMESQLAKVMEDARVMSLDLLEHRAGAIKGEIRQFDSMIETGLDKLEGVDKAMEDLIVAGLQLPAQAPESMETDQCCQLSLLITMVEFAKQHMASIIHSGIKHT